MWRDKKRNRKAARLADELRPPRDALKQPGTRQLQARPTTGDLIKGLFEAANEISAPISMHGFARYLRLLAIRHPKKFFPLLFKLVDAEGEGKGELQKVRQALQLAMEGCIHDRND